MGALRIAMAQINPTVGDLSGNVRKIIRWIDRARDRGADIVTFPELALCGYPPEDLLLKIGFLRDCRSALEKLAPHCRDLAVLVGFPDFSDGKVYNAAALLSDGNLLDVYHKIELPNYGVFDEKRYFDVGSRCLVFRMAGIHLSVTICEDIWIPGSKTERCAIQNGAEFVLNISGSPFHAGKQEAVRMGIVTRFAAATNTIVFYNNMVGGQDELVFDGGSMAVYPNGKVISCGLRFEEDLLVTDVEGRGSPVEESPWNLHGPMLEVAGSSGLERPTEPPRKSPPPTRVEEIYKALVLGTRDYIRKNGFTTVVVGLSGGIDSALTAAIAVEALGKDHVLGVTMPSRYTSDDTLSDAGRVAKSLGIRLITVPIEGIFRAYLDALQDPFQEGSPGIENENIQARIRGNILMALSNRFGWLVLTTGNKSETAVGYCTLYGDMAGGFAVIKDVPKTLVYEVCEYINTKAGTEVIPQSIVDRPPSAELRPDQKDEDSLPPYSALDQILRAYVEEDKEPAEIEGIDRDMVKDVVRMVDRNEYKRRQAPPGIRITPKAFGRDRRLPITNHYTNNHS